MHPGFLEKLRGWNGCLAVGIIESGKKHRPGIVEQSNYCHDHCLGLALLHELSWDFYSAQPVFLKVRIMQPDKPILIEDIPLCF
jgi:hypothetical protein